MLEKSSVAETFFFHFIIFLKSTENVFNFFILFTFKKPVTQA